MKNRMKYIVACVLAVGFAQACTENEMERYENSPAIYFDWKSEAGSQHDSINHSFFLDNTVIEETVYVRVNTMGKTADYERPIKIVQSNAGEPGAAQAGVHFKSFDLPEIASRMVVAPGEAYTMVPVVLLRHASLDLNRVRLEMAVEANEHFRPGIDQWRTFLVTTTNMAEKPVLWDTFWQYYFGPTWGSVKFRFIIDNTGYMDWETRPSDGNFALHLRNLVNQKFEEYNILNPTNPLKEANNDPVVFL